MRADEKKLELIKKLQALAERGVGGEKEGAQRKLAQLIEKYDINAEELMEDKLEDHDFTFRNEHEARILQQVMFKVAEGRERYTYRRGKGSRKTIGITCTKAEEIQIRMEYEYYRELWEEEVEIFRSAFIQKHRIFPIHPDKEANDNGLTREDALRMWNMMQGMRGARLTTLLEENQR